VEAFVKVPSFVHPGKGPLLARELVVLIEVHHTIAKYFDMREMVIPWASFFSNRIESVLSNSQRAFPSLSVDMLTQSDSTAFLGVSTREQARDNKQKHD